MNVPEARCVEEVLSSCPVCGDPIQAIIYESDGKVFQRSQCPRHPVSESLVFSSAVLYRRLTEWNRLIFPDSRLPSTWADVEQGSCESMSASENSPLLAVIDITNHCNFRCPICFAESNGRGEHYYLDLDRVRQMLRSLVDRRHPCTHVQFSGGEPTLHPAFPEIVAAARSLGFTHIQVATNGSRFVDRDYVRQCEEAGLHTLYLQFDSVDDDVNILIRGRRLLESKVRAIENIAGTGMRIVLVPTIAAGVNVHQIGPIFRFALGYSKHITGISIQPAAMVGRVEVASRAGRFNLAEMASEFSSQTGLTRFPDDWLPLSALSLLTRAIGNLRGQQSIPPQCDAHCSLGTYFCIDDDNRPHCLTRFFDLEKFLRAAASFQSPAGGGFLNRQVSRLKDLYRLSGCFSKADAPPGLTFERLLFALDGWEDKSLGRGDGWERRGFNGIFVAGMHFMDAGSYNFRRLRRCIVQYVTTGGQLIPFCAYNAGVRTRTVEDSRRIDQIRQTRPAAV